MAKHHIGLYGALVRHHALHAAFALDAPHRLAEASFTLPWRRVSAMRAQKSSS